VIMTRFYDNPCECNTTSCDKVCQWFATVDVCLGLPSTINHNRSSVDIKYIDINISPGRKDIYVFGC
jgi:hypothetical protein